MTTKFSKSVIRLGVPELELEIWDFWDAPARAAFSGELGGNPKLKNLRLALEFATVFTVNGCETRDVNLATIVVLMDALGEKVAGLHDLKNLAGHLDLGPLLVL